MGAANVAPFLSAIEKWPVVWNAPGWGSTTSVRLREDFGSLLPGEWREALLIGMKPGSLVPLHVDALYKEPTTRTHVVLSTNPDCWSLHDGVWQQLEEGTLWEMDQTLPHASVNLGKTIRWHLVVDTLKPL